MIHTERRRLCDTLEGLSPTQWQASTLCSDWTTEQVVAHLTAAALTGTGAWIRSIVRARFKPAVHNERLLSRRLGPTPEATLKRFRDATTSTIAPTKDYPAFLGEVIVHGQDIARPLGLDLAPDPAAVVAVATFYAAKDFAVNSKTLVAGLRLEADDADFAAGDGPLVTGPVLSLVMAMAGRSGYGADLSGDGADEWRSRL